MDTLEELYQQVILDHSSRKSGYGSVAGSAYASHQVNPTCGDEVTLVADLDTAGIITAVRWEGQGCSISQASLSMMTELVQGKTLAEVEALDTDFTEMMHSRGREVSDELLDRLEDAASLQGTSKFPNRVKCALLGWMALKDSIVKNRAEG